MEEGRSTIKILRDRRTEKRHSGRTRRRCEENIRINFKEIDINTRN